MLSLSPQAARAASPVELTILLRGQSNAYLLSYFGAATAIKNAVQALLGFDGNTNKINLVADTYVWHNLNTMNPGTALIGDWLTPIGGNWQNGWQVTALEQGLLNDIAGKPAHVRTAPTAVVWLHNEYDSKIKTLSTQEWVSAVQYDAALTRKALGQSAARVPYLFVNAIPWSEGSDASNQAIKLGMQQLAGNAGFNAAIASQAADLDMTYNLQTYQSTDWYAIGHMNSGDATQLVQRIARSVANQWSAYALPNSPVAKANFRHVPAIGPHVTLATWESAHSNKVVVTFAYDTNGLLQPLSAGARAGLGWSVHHGGTVLNATAAAALDHTHLELTFSGAVPQDGQSVLYYSYGVGRIAKPATSANPRGFPGQGNSIYDADGMPIWARASGFVVQAP